MPLTKAEQDFLEQHAREHLKEWCAQTIVAGGIVDVGGGGPTPHQKLVATQCLELAVEKGWVSAASNPRRVLARGFAVAESFLKR